jgi:hypothetical protein
MKTLKVAGATLFALLAGVAPNAPGSVSQREPAFAALTSPDLGIAAASSNIEPLRPSAVPATTAERGDSATGQSPPSDDASNTLARRHFDQDLEAMRLYRPGYEFWHDVFTIENGRMAFGSASDGSLIATFPLGKDWTRDAQWAVSSLPDRLPRQPVGRTLDERRDDTAQLLTEAVGPVVFNPTRGSFIAEGVERYGGFLGEWGAIYERFGVPAEVGLAQALVESGLRGKVRSDAEAIGFCQWLPRNWARLQKLSAHVIEADNQTTQAPYCAAHLAVLATAYGSLIPALSEHHAGSVNVGRTIINGNFAGGGDVRARYFLGAELTLLVRHSRVAGYQEVAGSFGPHSFRYAEIVFGNLRTIADLKEATPQERIFAMRPNRALSFDQIAKRTKLSADEIRRFNPALVNRVPAGANLYLPHYVEDFGPDTAFWHRPPAPNYWNVLSEFVRLGERFSLDRWHDGSVLTDLRLFETRFRATGTEEGEVMATVIAFVIGELRDGRQMEILSGFRNSERARQLLAQGVDRMEELFQSFEGGSGDSAQRNAFVTTAILNLR